tara:strand:- start:526 stop:1110 length:585 start_codon:yes stop_codon:yes gene_type:complete
MEFWLVLIVITAFFIYLIKIYNEIVNLRNRVDNGWSQIDVQLQRRYDLIPNLVETAKGYMKHEKETLDLVIKARNAAYDTSREISVDPSDSEKIKKIRSEEKTLQSAMMNFQALAENYPDLKSNTNMLQLQEELATTENKVAFSRQGFNDAVMQYNTGIEVFPNSLIAQTFKFKEASEWVLENEEAKQAVTVSF